MIEVILILLLVVLVLIYYKLCESVGISQRVMVDLEADIWREIANQSIALEQIGASASKISEVSETLLANVQGISSAVDDVADDIQEKRS
ncbi:MAG: hypothetical protein QM484_08685 [Woeseiaceae bacterium]